MTPRRSLLEGTTPSKSEIIAVCDFIEQVGKKEGWKPGDQALRAVRYLRAFAKENEELQALVVDAGKALSLEYAPAGDLEAWFKRVEKFATAILEREKP